MKDDSDLHSFSSYILPSSSFIFGQVHLQLVTANPLARQFVDQEIPERNLPARAGAEAFEEPRQGAYDFPL